MFARDGEAAIDLYLKEKSGGKPFDAVILDLSVPEGMGGKETIQKMRSIDPKIKAIISSGYSNDPVVQEYAHYGFSGRLTKPYKINDMKNILEEVISS
jgi:CheY-like chemotaxis protein